MIKIEIRNLIIGALVFILIFSTYLFTLVPSLTGDDSGELAGVCSTLGTAHSPGYPLYSLAGKINVTLLPWGNLAYRVNSISALYTALACSLLFFIILQLTGKLIVSIASAVTFGFSELVWAIANVTEVYGLTVFLAVLICLFVFRGASYRYYIIVAYLCGVCMTSHYTTALLFPGLAWWTFKNKKSIFGSKLIPGLFAGFIFLIMGFSAVLFIYVRGKTMPVFGWEDPGNLERFWQVIARARYGSMSLAQGGFPDISYEIILSKLIFFIKVISENFTPAGLIFFIVGILALAKERQVGWAAILMLLGTGPLFLVLANVTIDENSSALLKRFFFMPFIFIIIALGQGISKLPGRFSGIAILFPIFLFMQNFPELNRRQEYIFYDYAKNILRTTPKNAILFSDRADEMEFSVAYLHKAEGKRKDIDFIDCNAGVSRSIYGDNYYGIWGKPRLKIRERVEKEIISKTNRPVFYATFVPDMINIPRYQEGLLFSVRSNGPEFPCSEVYSLRWDDSLSPDDVRGKNLLISYYHLLGQYYVGLKNAQEAEKYFGSIDQYDRQGSWLSNAGFLYHKKGMLDQAEQYYLKVIKYSNADSVIYTNLGTIYERQGKLEEAEKLFNNALKLDRNNVSAHYNLAVLFWKQSRWDDVISELEIVLSLKPDHLEAKNYLDMAYTRKNVKISEE